MLGCTLSAGATNASALSARRFSVVSACYDIMGLQYIRFSQHTPFVFAFQPLLPLSRAASRNIHPTPVGGRPGKE